jgi:hypothetical protein
MLSLIKECFKNGLKKLTLNYADKINFIEGKNKLEEVILNTLIVCIPDLLILDKKDWESSKYTKFKARVRNKNFNFSDLEKVDSPCLIIQPNGSQNSPDFLLIINNIGVGIEAKSGNKNIMWNSGYPIPDWIYIIAINDKVTITLGQDLVKEDEILYLLKMDYCAKLYNSIYKNVEFYSRAAFYLKIKYIETKEEFKIKKAREQREQNVFNFINERAWTLNQDMDFSEKEKILKLLARESVSKDKLIIKNQKIEIRELKKENKKLKIQLEKKNNQLENSKKSIKIMKKNQKK